MMGLARCFCEKAGTIKSKDVELKTYKGSLGTFCIQMTEAMRRISHAAHFIRQLEHFILRSL